MKSYGKELYFTVPERRAFINITSQVDACLHESGIQEGLLLCNDREITLYFSDIGNKYNYLRIGWVRQDLNYAVI
jgi:hypothetical protein